MTRNPVLRIVLIVGVGAGMLTGGCSKPPPVPTATNTPASDQIDLIQKDPTLSAEQKQQKIQALQQTQGK